MSETESLGEFLNAPVSVKYILALRQSEMKNLRKTRVIRNSNIKNYWEIKKLKVVTIIGHS